MAIERGVPDPNEKPAALKPSSSITVAELIRLAKLGYSMPSGDAAIIVQYYEDKLAEVKAARDAYLEELNDNDDRHVPD